MSRRYDRIRLLVLVVVVVAALAALIFGDTGELTPERVRVALLDMGYAAPVVLLLLFWFVQPFLLSSHLLILAATLVWSPVETFLLGWLGTVGSGLTSFVFARFVARDWVQKRLPQKLHRFDRGLEEKGFRTVVLLRVLFFTTHPVQWMLGVSRVRFWPFLFGTMVGFIPGVALDVVIGGSVVAWLEGRLFN